jgi:hypothetical protein
MILPSVTSGTSQDTLDAAGFPPVELTTWVRHTPGLAAEMVDIRRIYYCAIGADDG